jgi:hypothetical protein
MDAKIKTLIINAIQQHRGDNYERAKASFAGLSQQQMKEPHYGSGQTRQQLLDAYRIHTEDCERAIQEIQRL